MKSINLKKLILPNLPYLLFMYLFDKVGQAARLAPGADLSGKLLSIGDGFAAAFSSFVPSLHPADLLVGVLGAALIRLVVYVKGKNAKKYRRGVEYGSARWGSAVDIRPYIDPVFENNVLLTQTERLMMNSRPKQPKYARNKNVLVVGGSGSGKTRFFVKPNLMQMHSSYLVSDPKGTLLLECGKLLERGSPKLGEDGKPVRKNGKIVYEPYRIKVLNTINFKKSMKYNPFAYLRDEKDILKLVNTLIANTKGSGEKSGEDFWVKAERLLYCALIGYIHYEAPDAERNFTTLLEMINATLFLGGKEKTTLKEISEVLGKETIDSFNTSENRGRDVSHGLNYQKLGKELMSQDEIAVMDGGKCILQLRGVRPFFSDKYDITKHPKYKYLCRTSCGNLI